MDVQNVLKQAISNALVKLDLQKIDQIEFSHPVYEQHGDYAVNIAMTIFAKSLPCRQAGKIQNVKSPREVARVIVENLQKNEDLKKIVSKIEIAGPGFINFWLSEEYLITSLIHIIEVKKGIGKFDSYKDKKVMVEYTDPNPFKEFHIGHLFSNIVGESLARLFEASGAIVKRACYQGDVGMHVAKAVWGMKKKLASERLTLDKLAEKPLIERQHFLGQSYALGAKAYEENEELKKEIEQLNKKIYELNADIKELYETGRKWSLEYFETIYKRLGTKFDYYYFEREAGERGLAFIKENLKKGVFSKSEGAVVFEGKKYGLHTRVFINKLGLPTYEAKDLGLAPTKYEDFPYDLSFIVTGNEVNEYFKVVFKALELINPDLVKKTKHVGHGMVRLPSGKMSSRTGNVLTGEWLLDETKHNMIAYIKESDKIQESDKGYVAEITTIGAVKYSLLKSGIGKDTIFDFKESLSFEGNSGPYLQYTYARARSVLRKSKIQNPKLQINPKSKIQSSKLTPEEFAILRTLHRFPEVVLEAGKNLAPNVICTYLFDLAQKFNLFYQKIPILNTKEEERNFRLQLTKATSQVIKNGLHLLGIGVLEKM